MVQPVKGNLLVGQSGGPTAVINSSLLGIIKTAFAAEEVIEGVYGLMAGVEGLLDPTGPRLVDFRREKSHVIELLNLTPSAALGTNRYKLRPEDPEIILDICRRYNVRYFCYIGGNDSADTAHRIATTAATANYELKVIGVPKTIDNDLPETDHCPGYGSVARFTALATMDSGLDTLAMRQIHPVKLIELMGRNAGWIVASAALGKRSEEEAPHLIYVPERPFDIELFLEDVSQTHAKYGYCVAAISENVRDIAGEPITAAQPTLVDSFGHPYFPGAVSYLTDLVRQRIGLNARFDKPGTITRMSSAHVSETDRAEAYEVGAAAVRAALAGETDKMVTLVRTNHPHEPYRCITGLCPLTTIANREKPLPSEFLTFDGKMVTPAFRTYLQPLVGPLPEYARLSLEPARFP